MPRSVVALLAAAGAAMFALLPSIHGASFWIDFAFAAVATGLAAYLSLSPRPGIRRAVSRHAEKHAALPAPRRSWRHHQAPAMHLLRTYHAVPLRRTWPPATPRPPLPSGPRGSTTSTASGSRRYCHPASLPRGALPVPSRVVIRPAWFAFPVTSTTITGMSACPSRPAV